MDNGKEKRVTNPDTGGQKGSKLSQLGWAPPDAMIELGKVYGHGAEKYDPHNFRKGYKWSLSYNALLRHLWASLAGEELDPDGGFYHMAAVAWHALTLLQFVIDTKAGKLPPDLDDRWESIRGGAA